MTGIEPRRAGPYGYLARLFLLQKANAETREMAHGFALRPIGENPATRAG